MNYSTQNLSNFFKKQLGYLSAIALGLPLFAMPSLAQIIPVETTPSSNPATLPSENPNDKAANPTDNKTARFSCQSRDGLSLGLPPVRWVMAGHLKSVAMKLAVGWSHTAPMVCWK